MQTYVKVGMSGGALVIISRALKLFVENLLKKANDITSQRGARTLTPSHL
jgi:histone H3/H4